MRDLFVFQPPAKRGTSCRSSTRVLVGMIWILLLGMTTPCTWQIVQCTHEIETHDTGFCFDVFPL